MSIAVPQLSVFSLTSALNDVNALLTTISERRSQLSMQQATLICNKGWYSDDDAKVKLALLASQDNLLDLEQGKLETKSQAISKNLEAQEKLLQNNIKEDFEFHSAG